ncbi:MAG: AAA family ATPase [Proteobacteria bacterium]|nr:AAA family ATPase [Pseudomonadota bacterium]
MINFIPKWLYYFDKKPSYTTTVTGNFEVERFIATLPDYWLQEEGENVLKKKTLVFTHTFHRYGSRHTRALKSVLARLLKEGFSLYAWQNDPIAITQDNIDNFFNKHWERGDPRALKPKSWHDLFAPKFKINSEHPDKITKIMAQKGICADELLLMGYFEQRQLLADMSDYFRQELTQELVGCIDLMDWSIDNLAKIKSEKIKKEITLAARDKNFSRFVLLNRPYQRVDENNIDSINSEIGYDQIEEISYYSYLGKQFETVFKKAKNLKKLSLGLLPTETLPQLHPEAMLEELYLNGFDDSADKLFRFLAKHGKNLKKLELACCFPEKNSIKNFKGSAAHTQFLQSQALKNLNEIILQANELEDLPIIEHSSQLKSIYIADLDAALTIPNSIEEIGVCADEEYLHIFLTSFENLKTLILTGNHTEENVVNQKIDWHKKPLPSLNLEKLDLGNSILSPEFLFHILKNAKKLKVVDITHANHLKQALKEARFDEFRTVFVDRTEIEERLKKERQEALAAVIKKQTIFQKWQSFFLSNKAQEQSGSSAGSSFERARQCKTRSIDADTDPQKVPNLQVERIFYARAGLAHPHPKEYRLQAFQKVLVKESALKPEEDPFILIQEPPNLVDCEPPKWCQSEKEVIQARDEFGKNSLLNKFKNLATRKEVSERYYARSPINLSQEWEVLPSYYAQEKITHFYIKGFTANEVEFKYLKDQAFYCIRLKEGHAQVMAHYVIEVPPIKPLPPILAARVEYYLKEFKPKKLTREGKTLISGQDYYREINQQKCGACRHRAIVEKVNRQKTHPNEMNQYIGNDCHAFIEVNYQGYLHKCDLGGYPVNLNIHENTNLGITPQKKQSNLSDVDIVINKESLNSHFVTWETPKQDPTLISDFTNQILAKSGKNILLKTPSDGVMGYQIYLQDKCLAASRPVYYIDSAKDCVCSSRWIERSDNQGILRKGPGGRLHQFLLENQGKSPVIIVNWDNFNPNEIARTNTIIDEVRKIDSTLIPKEALVIGFYDPNKPDAYRVSDLDSRFDEKVVMPFAVSDLQRCVAQLLNKIKLKENDIQTHKIDLLNSIHWRAILLGQWVLAGTKFIYKPGELIDALKKESIIEIANGPWHLPEFQLFWLQFLLHKNVKAFDENLTLGADTQFVKSVGYNWENLTKHIHLIKDAPFVHVLNPTTLGQFITTYTEVDEELFATPGKLAQYQNQTMNIELTRNLSEEQWVRLLKECEKINVTLLLIQRESHVLPQAMQNLKTVTLEGFNKQKHQYQLEVHLTNNIDKTIEAIQQETYMRAVNISECKSSELMMHHDAKWLDEVTFNIKQRKAGILRALQQGENLILYGNFSQECVDSLAELCVENAVLPTPFTPLQATKPGKLILVTQQTDSFKFTTTKKHKFATQALKEQNPPPKEQSPEIHELDLSLQTSDAFESDRLAQIKAGLSKAPTLLIEGPTGAGKTTIIFNTLRVLPEYAVFVGLESLHHCLTEHIPGKEKILFVDEANLTNQDFTMFDGLYQNPPFIYYDGEFYNGKNLKVIFAANPNSYGGERKKPSFFEAHPNAITFNALPEAMIYHRILKPLFKDGDKAHCCELFLQIYHKIVSLSKDTVLMTPRELELMALEVLSKDATKQRQHALQIAYLLGKSVLAPTQQKDFKDWFEQQFKDFKRLNFVQNFKIGDFLVTHSRIEAYQLVSSLLNIRDYQQQSAEKENMAGLAGMLIEGESAEGKSKFIIEMLKYYGYQEAPIDLSKAQQGKIFYHLPVSMSAKEKKEFLLKAFHEGAVVVIDEINSSEILEETLNAIAMGRDLAGKKAKVAGFKLFGTLNPIDYPGRRPISLAVKRRFVQCQFLPYDEGEIVDLLLDQGITQEGAQLIARDYFAAKQYAIKNHLSPCPNFRNVKRAAAAYLAGKYSINKVDIWFDTSKNATKEKKYWQDLILHPTKHPVALGVLVFVAMTSYYGVMVALGVSLTLALVLQLRNWLHQRLAQFYVKTDPELTKKGNIHTPFAAGLQAGNSWFYYFKSCSAQENWRYYPEFAAGLEHAYQESRPKVK